MPPLTPYFRNKVSQQRTDIELEWISRILRDPHGEMLQPDGRWRFWGYIVERDKFLRVVTLEDRQTILNAFFDRNYSRRNR